jgi:hypothetical protein
MTLKINFILLENLIRFFYLEGGRDLGCFEEIKEMMRGGVIRWN